MDTPTARDGGGAYWRDAAGTWRYADDDEPVPGARDLRLDELYRPPLVAPELRTAGPDGGDGPDRSDGLDGSDGPDGPDRIDASDAAASEPVRLVPRAWASRHPDHPLAWIFAYATLGGREDVAVPAAVWDARARDVVAMAAPELHPHNLLGVDGVAALLGVSPSTVRAYAARGQMPEPIARLGGSPLWARALIERWLPLRRQPRRADADPREDEPVEP